MHRTRCWQGRQRPDLGGLGDDDIYGHAWDDSGRARNDRAVFDGDFADFSFEAASWCDGNCGKMVTEWIVTDKANGGNGGFYEGRDRLNDIDVLVFADQSIAFDTLI